MYLLQTCLPTNILISVSNQYSIHISRIYIYNICTSNEQVYQISTQSDNLQIMDIVRGASPVNMLARLLKSIVTFAALPKVANSIFKKLRLD